MGDSKQTQTSSQNTSGSSSTNPWAPATSYLQGVLGNTANLYGQTTNSALPGALQSGQNQAIANASGGATTNLANQGFGDVSNLLGGTGLSSQQQSALGGVGSALGAFNTGNRTTTGYLTPIADGSQLGASNPEFQQELQASLSKARDTIGSQFAGAGRYGSAAMGNAEATQLGNIAATATQSQYNTDRSNQLAAIGQLSGLSTSGLSGNLSGQEAVSGIGQQGIANQLAGIGLIPGLNTSQNLDANNLMTTGNQGWSNLDNAASLYSSIGGMGGTSTSTGQSNGTATTQNQQSPLGMLLAGIGGVGNLFSTPTGGTSAFSAAKSLFSDRRLKADIVPVGTLFDGQTVYAYRYSNRLETHLGLMADEVAQNVPEAVGVMPGTEYLGVDYGKATARAAELGGAT